MTAAEVRAVDQPSSDAESEIRVRRLDDQRVYAATIDGREVVTLRYDEVDGRVIGLTTTVLPDLRGRGIAPALIADALDDIKERGHLVRVLCPLVAAFMAENQQYLDLVDPERPGVRA